MTSLEERLNTLGDVLDDHYGPIALHELAGRADAHATNIEEFVGQGSLVASVGTADDSAESEVCDACGADLTVFDLRQPVENPAPTPRKRLAVVAAAVAAALLLVVGIVVADRNSGNVVTDAVSSPSVVEPVAPPAVPDPVVRSSVVDDLGYRWSRVAHDEAVFGGPTDQAELNGVTAGGPGLVAVGLAGSTMIGDAAVWTSADGITWSRVPHDEAVFGHQEGGVIAMKSVTNAGSLLVAVGDQNKCCSYNVAAAVWTSPDGVTWSRVPHDEAVFDRAGMNSVTAGGPGVVAVGFEFLAEEHVIAVVWSSPDGITWSRVPHDESVFDRAEIESVTAGGPGLVAVGASYPDDHPRAAVVWTSPDGITWSRVPHDEAVFDESGMNSVTAGGPGLVAVGWSEDGESDVAAVWTSPDGITWSRVPHDEAVFGGAGMFSVTAGGPGLVAVGFERVDEDNLVAAAWTSSDGITWSRVPHDEAVFGGLRYQEMYEVTAARNGLVAVGSANRNGGDFADAAVWVATPTN